MGNTILKLSDMVWWGRHERPGMLRDKCVSENEDKGRGPESAAWSVNVEDVNKILRSEIVDGLVSETLKLGV